MTEPGRQKRDPVRQRQGENYILIAMPNVNRGAAYRAVVSEAACDTVLVRDGEEAKQELARRGPGAADPRSVIAESRRVRIAP